MSETSSPLTISSKRIRKPSKRVLEDVDEDYVPEYEMKRQSTSGHHHHPSTPRVSQPHQHVVKSHGPLKSSLSSGQKGHKSDTGKNNLPGVIVTKKKQPSTPMAPPTPIMSDAYDNMMGFLHKISGQTRELKPSELDHSYNKRWNSHPDPNMKCKPAKYLFMSEFPKHFMRPEDSEPKDGMIDIETVDPVVTNPLVRESLLYIRKSEPIVTQLPAAAYYEKSPVIKTNWTPNMHRLWNKSLKILSTDRLCRLTFEGKDSAVILERNLLEKTSSRFRQLFSVVSLWDASILGWLNATLNNHVVGALLTPYHDSMQYLRTKIPSLIDKFYPQQNYKSDSAAAATGSSSQTSAAASGFRKKTLMHDAPQNVLNMYRPKRIPGSPLFLIVPNGPQVPHSLTSQRMKHWHSLFGSMGKVLTVTVMAKSKMRAAECLNEIRYAVRDQIRECKSRFNESRPLILVGFGESSLIAAHSALEHPEDVTATICLGFPITAVNGFRGDLDDPLLETSVPTLFIIGQNSTKCGLDDMEDFRERITKAETGLIVVGGCNDRLILCSEKKRQEVLNQTVIDRCLSDEINDFVSGVLHSNALAAATQNMINQQQAHHHSSSSDRHHHHR